MHCIAYLAILSERSTEVPDLKKIVTAVLEPGAKITSPYLSARQHG